TWLYRARYRESGKTRGGLPPDAHENLWLSLDRMGSGNAEAGRDLRQFPRRPALSPEARPEHWRAFCRRRVSRHGWKSRLQLCRTAVAARLEGIRIASRRSLLALSRFSDSSCSINALH